MSSPTPPQTTRPEPHAPSSGEARSDGALAHPGGGHPSSRAAAAGSPAGAPHRAGPAPLRVGFVGSGLIARVHGPLVLRDSAAALVGIADPDAARAEALAETLGGPRAYPDAEALLEAERPDVVHVLTPPEDHARSSILALRRGCHVLVEKPMALTVEDARAIADAARESGVRLCVNHNMVAQDVVQRALALVAAGALGEVSSVEASYAYDARRNPDLLEQGAELCQWVYRLNGGPLQDHFPHPASLVAELLPEIEEVRWIERRRGVLPEPWADELRVLVAAGRVLGTISLSLSEQPDAITFTVKGLRGTVRADLFNGTVTVQTKSPLPRAVARGLAAFRLGGQNLRDAAGNVVSFATGRVDRSNGVGRVIAGFYEAIRTGAEVPTAAEKGLRVVELTTRVWPSPPPGALAARSLPAGAGRPRREPDVLVTGASGFIGSHLVRRLLEEGAGVRALVRPNSAHAGRLRRLPVEIASGDLADPAALRAAARGVRTVYHAGATLGNDPAENRRTTVEGTRHLLAAALAGGVERFVHLSTLAVYDLDRVHSGDVVTEDAPLGTDPGRMGGYAHAKVEAERLVLEAQRDRGLGASVVRPGIVIGPLGRVFFPHLGFRQGDTLFLPSGRRDRILPLTYVENTVEGILAAARAEAAVGRAYHLVDAGDVTLREYLERFVEVTGLPARIVWLPYAVPWLLGAGVEAAAAAGVLRKRPTSRAQVRWKHLAVRFDATRAREELGWREPVPLREGLRRTFEWYARGRGPA